MSQKPYPYMPEGKTFRYVSSDDEYMKQAIENAQPHIRADIPLTSSVIVRRGQVIGSGVSGEYHRKHGCERVRQNIPPGEGYELCPGCSAKNHSEPLAIRDAKAREEDTSGADLYLWGMWWCCEPCWREMERADIRDVYLLENAEVLFDREHPDNIVGKQI